MNNNQNIEIKIVDDESPGYNPQKTMHAPQVTMKLRLRKTLSGDLVFNEHPDVDIVISPANKKITVFAKEIMDDKIYGVQKNLFDFLAKKGVIYPDSVQAGNVYFSLEAKIQESADNSVDSVQVATFVIGLWFEDEEENFMRADKIVQNQKDDMTNPDSDETTPLGKVPHHKKQGSINPRLGKYGWNYNWSLIRENLLVIPEGLEKKKIIEAYSRVDMPTFLAQVKQFTSQLNKFLEGGTNKSVFKFFKDKLKELNEKSMFLSDIDERDQAEVILSDIKKKYEQKILLISRDNSASGIIESNESLVPNSWKPSVKNIDPLTKYYINKKIGEGAEGIIYRLSNGMILKLSYGPSYLSQLQDDLFAGKATKHSIMVYDHGQITRNQYWYLMNEIIPLNEWLNQFKKNNKSFPTELVANLISSILANQVFSFDDDEGSSAKYNREMAGESVSKLREIFGKKDIEDLLSSIKTAAEFIHKNNYSGNHQPDIHAGNIGVSPTTQELVIFDI